MVKITGIGWRLKFYFFLDFVVPINSMLQHTSSPPPSLPRALDYSLCPRSRHLKKKAFSRVGYLNVTRVRQGIWTRIVKSFQWNKMSDEEYGNLNKPIFRNSNAQWGYPGRGVWRWSFVLIDVFYWKALRESFPRATKETMYKSLWSHKGLKPNHLSY